MSALPTPLRLQQVVTALLRSCALLPCRSLTRQQPQYNGAKRARSQRPIQHTETHPTPTHAQGCGASTPTVADGATDCVVKPVDGAAVTTGKPVPAAPAVGSNPTVPKPQPRTRPRRTSKGANGKRATVGHTAADSSELSFEVGAVEESANPVGPGDARAALACLARPADRAGG